MAKTRLDLTEFKQSWKIVLVSVLGIALTANASLLYSFGTLISPLEKAYGWNQSQVQSSVTALFIGAIIGLQLAGWINQKIGIRRSIIVCLMTSAIGYLSIVTIIPVLPSIWLFYILIAFLPIAGAGAMTVTWTELIALWFTKNRGLALAIGLSGTGLAAVSLPPTMAFAISEWDWRAVFIILGALNIVLVLPLTYLLVYEPATAPKHINTNAEETGTVLEKNGKSGFSYAEAMIAAQFWMINIALMLVTSAVFAMITSTIPLLQDRGFDPIKAASIFSAFGLALIFGRVVVGFLLDRLRPWLVSGITMLLPALGCSLILFGDTTTPMLIIGSFLVGFGAGAEFDIAAFLVARYFGLREYSRLFGLHLGLVTAAGAATPLLVSLMLEKTSDYAVIAIYSLSFFFIGGILLAALGPARERFKSAH